jgi:hypothetical protein
MTTYTDSQRARYMRHELTFSEYYGLLVEHLGEGALRHMLPIPRTPAQWRELIAKDEHLNNVPLSKWDAQHPHVQALVRLNDRDKRAEITGSNGWSLSDSVCVLKETARRYAQS